MNQGGDVSTQAQEAKAQKQRLIPAPGELILYLRYMGWFVSARTQITQTIISIRKSLRKGNRISSYSCAGLWPVHSCYL
jgi:hypothetical protein